MALYEYSWLILLAPLFAFAVIVFGTRPWDMRSRGSRYRSYADQATAEVEHNAHGDTHAAETDAEHSDEHDEHDLEDDEDPQVPQLTTAAKVSGYLSIVIMAFACLYSWLLLFASTGVLPIAPPLPAAGIHLNAISYYWLQQPIASYYVSFHLDTLGIAMMVVVTTVSLLVQFYSQGYMENSAGYARFFAYLSLFAFSMLMIVFAENFLVIFVGWELVGLSSYLLIGFWINKRARPAEDRLSPASASIEAFIVNRVGDVGFIIGIMILFASTGTFEFSQLSSGIKPFSTLPASQFSVLHMNQTLLTVAMILVFCGAIGKSAQVPLHVWLPPAMEGPTPVSALIHAATMVAAGVYMVARTFPLFSSANPAAFGVVAWIGGITAIFAATIALVQYDFKRVLAFSTISQLGYMFVGLGVGGELGPGPGMFHLFTHAFFKALLFLGAGSVLHALHHAMHREGQDMRLMGGLAKFMPITAGTWLIATLSISGFPFFAGFYSKDNIISLAFDHGYYGLWAITLLTAGLTAFYMLRAYILAFGGQGGDFCGLWGGPYRGTGEPHESPATITIPLILLAIASIIAGYWTGFFSYIQPGVPDLNIAEVITNPLTWLGVVVALAGFAWAYTLYCRVGMERVHQVVESNAVLLFLYNLTLHKFYTDDLYDLLVRYVVLGISHVEQAFDAYVVDGLVNGVSRLVMTAGRDLRYVETGKVQSYMAAFFGGIAILIAVVFVLVSFVK